jgi:citronellol/citronellal dehydrogenase
VDPTGQVALVTGASRGIGAATAVALAAAGADVACAARSTSANPRRVPGTLEETVGRVEAQGRKALAVPTDLAVDDDVVAMVRTTLEHFGRLDILVNNAGVTFFGDLDVDLGRYDLTLAINLRAPLVAIREAAPAMAASGGGTILNVSSLAAVLPQPKILAYGVAKAGLERLSVDAAQLLHGQGTVVNCLRIDMAVASEGFVANTPGMDRTGWESCDAAAEALVWMLRQPRSYTGRIESLFDLRRRDLLPSALPADRDATGPPTQLVTGLVDPSAADVPVVDDPRPR